MITERMQTLAGIKLDENKETDFIKKIKGLKGWNIRTTKSRAALGSATSPGIEIENPDRTVRINVLYSHDAAEVQLKTVAETGQSLNMAAVKKRETTKKDVKAITKAIERLLKKVG
jgi:hypothetical protein